MSEVKDIVTRAAVRCIKHGANIERLPLPPGLKRGRSENVVQYHRQFHTVFSRKECLDGERAKIIKGRSLCLQYQLFEFHIPALTPLGLKNVGEQNMLTRTERINIGITDQTQQRSDCTDDFFA